MNDEEPEWDKFQFLFNYFINYNKGKRKKKMVHLYRCNIRGIVEFRFRSFAKIKIEYNDFLNDFAFDLYYQQMWHGNGTYKSAKRDYERLPKEHRKRLYNFVLAYFEPFKYDENFGQICRNHYIGDKDFKNEIDKTLNVLN